MTSVSRGATGVGPAVLKPFPRTLGLRPLFQQSKKTVKRTREKRPAARTHLPYQQQAPIFPAHQRSRQHDRAARMAAAKRQGKHTQYATKQPPHSSTHTRDHARIPAPAHEIMCGVEYSSGHQGQLAFSCSAALLRCTLCASVPTRVT